VNPAAPQFAAIVLAAGRSTRMGAPKALLDAGGEAFLDRLARIFGECGCKVYAVVGEDAGQIREGVRRASEITFVVNPEPERGQFSSLQCGLREAAAGVDGIFFTPVDAPGVARETVEAMQRAFGKWDYILPWFKGRTGHPVLMRASRAADFLALPASVTARDAMNAAGTAALVLEVTDSAVLDDIDDEAAYAAWRQRAPVGGGRMSREQR